MSGIVGYLIGGFLALITILIYLELESERTNKAEGTNNKKLGEIAMKKYKGTVYGNVVIGTELSFDGLTEEEIVVQMKMKLQEIGEDVLMDYTNPVASGENLGMIYLKKEEC